MAYCTARQCWLIRPILVKCSRITQTFIGLRGHLVIGQLNKYQFSLPFIGQPAECRTKHPLDKTPPAHFGIGGQNTPHVFYRVDITPPATYERVDKTPLVSFARWTKSPLSCGQNPPQTEVSVFIIAIEFWSLE